MQSQVIKEAIDKLLQHKKHLESELADITRVLNILKSDRTTGQSITNNDNKEVETGYDASWSSSKKLLYVLNREDRFLQFKDVAAIICDIENGDEDHLKSIIHGLRYNTSTLKEKNKIVKYNPSETNNPKEIHWGFPEWLDENGEPIGDYFRKN